MGGRINTSYPSNCKGRYRMGLFGDKLMLRLNASSMLSGQLKLQIEKADNKARHLLPFSCLSLIGSQLTVLTSQHTRSLSNRVLDFVEDPKNQFEATNLVSGFKLQLFEGSGHILYNQFEPLYSRTLSALDDNHLQSDIQRILMNYVTGVFDESGNTEKSDLKVFLLMTVAFYQQEIIPIIKRINMRDIEQRNRLARTVIDFTSTLYRSWDNPKSIAPGNKIFMDNLSEAKEFNSYLM